MDKLRALQLLSRKGIGLPVTGFAHSPDDVPDLIQMVNGAPLVIKVLEGTQGIGVVLCETQKAAESVIEAFMGLKQDIMVQEYIKEAGGADIRCFVIGDKVIASMKRFRTSHFLTRRDATVQSSSCRTDGRSSSASFEEDGARFACMNCNAGPPPRPPLRKWADGWSSWRAKLEKALPPFKR